MKGSQREAHERLRALGYTLSYMDRDMNPLPGPDGAATWSAMGAEGGFWTGRVPKRKPLDAEVLGQVSRRTAYSSLAPLFAGLLRASEAYPTTYGLGVVVILKGAAEVEADRVAVSARLTELGIEHRTEYSPEHWVFRFVVSKSAENLARVRAAAAKA